MRRQLLRAAVMLLCLAAAVAGWEWATPQPYRSYGLAVPGSLERLADALARAEAGRPLRITALGGSNSQANDRPGRGRRGWLPALGDFVREHYPQSNVSIHAGSVSGQTALYFAECWHRHLHPESDIIIIELAINNRRCLRGAQMDQPVNAAMERLVRSLLDLPHKPAVLFLNIFVMKDGHRAPGDFHGNEQEWHTYELASYYQLPLVSLRACCHRLLREQRVHGFNSSTYATQMLPDRDKVNWADRNLFFFDQVHPSTFGNRVLAELLGDLFLRTPKLLAARPGAFLGAGLPAPMLPSGEHARGHGTCVFDGDLRALAKAAAGFEWVGDASSANPDVPRWGWLGNTTGAALTLRLPAPRATAAKAVDVRLYVVESWRDVGQAVVSCSGGCSCKATTFDMFITKFKHSIPRPCRLQVQHTATGGACDVTVAVGPKTSSSGHVVKVTGLAIMDQA